MRLNRSALRWRPLISRYCCMSGVCDAGCAMLVIVIVPRFGALRLRRERPDYALFGVGLGVGDDRVDLPRLELTLSRDGAFLRHVAADANAIELRHRDDSHVDVTGAEALREGVGLSARLVRGDLQRVPRLG